MRKIMLHTFWIFAAGVLLYACNGGGDTDPQGEKTKEQLATEALTGGSHIVWTVANGGSVSKDGQSLTADYQNFELSFVTNANNRTYSSSANPLFDRLGDWSFAGENFDKIQLSGSSPAAGREISFSREGDRLRLQFAVPMPVNARVNALAGSYIFELIKK